MPEKRAILIPVAQLLFDPEIQMRTGLDDDHLGDLVSALKAGEDLPPIDVFPAQGDDPIGANGEHYYIADGNHRGSAYRLADREQIAIYQHTGGRAAAIKFALGANAEHNALRRTNSDKRKAVKTALNSHYAIFGTEKIKNVAIAEACRVAESFVRKIRQELEKDDEDEGPKDKHGRTPDQLFMDFYFQKRTGAIPRLRMAMNSADYAAATREQWAALVGELNDLVKTAERHAGLVVGANRGKAQ